MYFQHSSQMFLTFCDTRVLRTFSFDSFEFKFAKNFVKKNYFRLCELSFQNSALFQFQFRRLENEHSISAEGIVTFKCTQHS